MNKSYPTFLLCFLLALCLPAMSIAATEAAAIEKNCTYHIVNAHNRGELYYAPGQSAYYVWSTGRTAATAESANAEWTFVPAGKPNTYYIYNVGRGRYIAPASVGSYAQKNAGGKTWIFTPERVPVTIVQLADGQVGFQTAADKVCLSVSNSYSGPVISYPDQADQGFAFNLVQKAPLDKAARKALKRKPSLLTASDLSVTQGFQTTGRGNQHDVILRIDLIGYEGKSVVPTQLGVALKGNSLKNISALQVFQTMGDEFYAEANPAMLGELKAIDTDRATIALTGAQPLRPGVNHLWLTASVKADARLGDIIDAAITSVTCDDNGKTRVIVLGATGDPEAQGLKIFATQSFAFVPKTDGCNYYRIPAMVLDKEGNIVVATDRRYDTDYDLGNHKIDVSVRRSTDGGHTWSPQTIIAEGDGRTESDFGYGDAALARTLNGRLICVMAAGVRVFWNGMQWGVVCHSDDNGLTWSQPRQIFTSCFEDLANETSDSLGFYGLFTSSGKGLTTREGTVMFTTNCIRKDNKSIQCYILASTDNGENWTLGPGNAYPGADESKLEQLNDGQLLVSVRQHGARGFNRGTPDGKEWGTPWRNEVISGNACNADILYYSRKTEGQRDILLHTYIKANDRRNLTLAMSTDEGVTWRDVYNIQPGYCAYSTMVKLNDGSVAILYEDESYSAGNGYAATFVTLTAEQIEAWAAAN